MQHEYIDAVLVLEGRRIKLGSGTAEQIEGRIRSALGALDIDVDEFIAKCKSNDPPNVHIERRVEFLRLCPMQVTRGEL